MSIALVLVIALCGSALMGWLLGILHPRFSRTSLAIVSAVTLMVPGAATLSDAPLHIVGLYGEDFYRFANVAGLSLISGIPALTVALLARQKLRPFGIMKEEI